MVSQTMYDHQMNNLSISYIKVSLSRNSFEFEKPEEQWLAFRYISSRNIMFTQLTVAEIVRDVFPEFPVHRMAIR